MICTAAVADDELWQSMRRTEKAVDQPMWVRRRLRAASTHLRRLKCNMLKFMNTLTCQRR